MDNLRTDCLLDVTEKTVDFTVLSLSWIPCSARIISIGAHQKGHGVLSVHTLAGRELNETSSIKTDRPLRCGTFDLGDQNERVFCSGDFSGNICLWDIESLKRFDGVTGAHSDLINSIASGGKGSSEILTGGRDGEVKLWDRRTLSKPTVRMFPENYQTKRDCWTVSHSANQSTSTLVAAGFDNGDVKVFDLRAMKVLWETNVGRGVSHTTFLVDDTTEAASGYSRRLLLAAGTVHGKIFSWQVEKPKQKVSSLQLDKSTVWCTEKIATHSPLLISCLGSGALCFSRQDNNNGNMKCVDTHQISESPITSVTVSKDKPGLISTASCDNKIRLFIYTAIK